jgi:hypothetical protein
MTSCPAWPGDAAARYDRSVGVLHGWPVLAGLRVVWLSPSSPLVRVAALVEVAGSAASLARLLTRTRHVDPRIVSALVEYPVDVPAVLGYGRWAPHTPRPVVLPLAVHRRTLVTVEESFGGRVA